VDATSYALANLGPVPGTNEPTAIPSSDAHAPAREVRRLAHFLRSGSRLIILCGFIVAVAMLSPRLSPNAAGVVALIGAVGVAAGALAFWFLARGVHHLGASSPGLRVAEALLVTLRRLGLPILALGFFLLWTFVYLALWWYHPEEAFTGLVRDGQNPRFSDFFYYSVMTAFISPPNDIIAASRGARSATLIEMLTGLSLLATYLSSLVELPVRRPTDPPADPAGSDAG
jgi:hypothetical protein